MPVAFRHMRGFMLSVLLSVASVSVTAPVAQAQTIIEEWAKVNPPAPPELKPVALDAKVTALLILDMSGTQDPSKGACSAANRPRCVASIAKVETILKAARAAGALIVYSLGRMGMPSDIATAIAPNAADPVVRSGPDKFVGTDLDRILSSHGIKTIIVTGTTAEGAVLDTAADAVFRDMNVVVPVDGMSASELYAEQYVAWHLAHAPAIAAKVKLTRSDLIKF